MYGTQFIVLTVFAALRCTHCKPFGTPIAGKCHTFNITAAPTDIAGAVSLREWETIYASDVSPYTDVDHDFVYVTDVADGIFRADDIRTHKDQASDTFTWIGSFSDNIAYQDTVDENGERHHFRLIPLATSIDQGILHYRCSDSGDPNLDTRYIQIPKGKTLSKAGLEYLLGEDKKYKFKGELKKLPHVSEPE